MKMKNWFKSAVACLAAAIGLTASAGVAKIGNTEYDSLEMAAAAAKSGDTIEMLADYTVAEGVEIAINDGVKFTAGEYKLVNNGSITVSGEVKFSAGSYTGNLIAGKEGVATTFTTDKLVATKGNLYIADGSTVTMSGDGFDFLTDDDPESGLFLMISDSAEEKNSYTGDVLNHKGFTLNIVNTTQKPLGFQTYAFYPNGNSTINVKDCAYVKTEYLNNYGGTFNATNVTELVVDQTINLTGEMNVIDSTANVSYVYVYAGCEAGWAGGKFTAVNSLIDGQDWQMKIGGTRSGTKYYVKGDDSSAVFTLVNSTLTTSSLENQGTIRMDASSKIVIKPSGEGSGSGNYKSGAAGCIEIDMTGATADSYTLVTATSADYGTAGTNYKFAEGTEGDYELVVEGNNLLAQKKPVAQIGDTKYRDLATAFANAKEGDTVTLLRDIDLTGTEWTPVNFNGTFDGNGKTISGLSIVNTSIDYTGFFCQLWGGTVKNLTFDGGNTAVIRGIRTSVLAGAAQSCVITNVCVKNYTIKGIQKCGGLIGYLRGWDYSSGPNNFMIADCTVQNLKILGLDVEGVWKAEDGVWQAGGIFGYMAGGSLGSIINNTVSGIEIDDAYLKDIAGGLGKMYTSHAFIGVMCNNEATAESYESMTITLSGNKTDQCPEDKVYRDLNYSEFIGDHDDCERRFSSRYPTKLVIDGVEVTRPVAQVGAQQYLSLEKAIKNVENGGEIVLIGDVNENFTAAPKAGVTAFSITNAGGYKLEGKVDAPADYKFVIGEKGCTFQAKDYVCQIGDTKYETLADALIPLNKLLGDPVEVKILKSFTEELKEPQRGYSFKRDIRFVGVDAKTDYEVTLTNPDLDLDFSSGTEFALADNVTLNAVGTGISGDELTFSGAALLFGVEGSLVTIPSTGYVCCNEIYIDESATLRIASGTLVATDLIQVAGTTEIDASEATTTPIKVVDYNYFGSATVAPIYGTVTVKKGYAYVGEEGSPDEGDLFVALNLYQDPETKGLWHIVNAEGLREFRDSVNAGTSYANATIKIEADIDLTNDEGGWEPIKAFPGYHLAGATIDGGNHTIKGMTQVIPAPESGNVYGGGFIDKTASGITIKDLKFKDATVTSTAGSQVGIVLGMTYGNVTLDNVDLVNCTVTGQTKTGLYVGQNDSGTVTLRNCDVVNSQAKANYSSAMLIGLLNSNSNGADLTENNTVDDASKFVWIDDAEQSGKGFLLNGRYFRTTNGDTVIVITDPGEKCLAEQRVAGDKIRYNNKTYTLWGSKFYPEYAFDAQIGLVKYDSLAAAVADAIDDDTIVVLRNCKGDGIKIDKSVTIDFGGYTYTVDGTTTGSPGTETLAFQLLKGNEITFKNGTITSTTAKMLIQNYASLKLIGMTLDGASLLDGGKRYTLSNNCGETTIGAGTTVIAKEGGVAFDVFYWPKGGYGEGVSVTVDAGATIQGAYEYGNDGTEEGFLEKTVLVDKSGKLTAPYGYKWNDEGRLVLDNFYQDKDDASLWHIRNLEGLGEFAASVAGGNNYANKTVKLDNDIDMSTVTDWAPIGPDSGKCFSGTFDGNGKTISKLTYMSELTYGGGFFGNLVGSAVVKNVTFDTIKIESKLYNDAGRIRGNVYGVVSGYAYGNVAFEGVTVKNSQVKAYGKVAGILGMAADSNGETSFKDCSVIDTTVAGTYNCATFCGCVQNAISVENCTGKATWAANPLDNDTNWDRYGEIPGYYGIYAIKDSSPYYCVAWADKYVLLLADDGKLGSELADGILPDVAKIGDTKFKTLESAVAAAQSGDTVTVITDCKGNGIQIAKSLTIDFGGCTYTVDGTTTGSEGTKTQAFQLLKGNTITFKNGTITSTTAKMLIQNYSNLTLADITLDGSKLLDGDVRYTLSNNNGVTTIKAGTKIIAKEGGIAFDCFYWPTSGYPSVSVTVEEGATIKGDIEYANDGTTEGFYANAVVYDYTKTIKAPAGYVWDDTRRLCAIVCKIAEQGYPTLESAVKAAQSGETITVIANCAGNGIQIAKSLTIDFGGFTYTVDGTTTGSEGTKTQAFQLLKGNDITFKNGTITSTTAKMLVQNYANLTLANITLDGSKLLDGAVRYTLSNNCGQTTIKAGTKIIAKEGGIAFDCFYWPSSGYTKVSVTVEAGAEIQGSIEYAHDKTDAANFEKNASVYDYSGNVTAPSGFVWTSANKLASPVATIGTENYGLLEDAITAVKEGETIVQVADVELTKQLVMTKKGYTLDGNGFRIFASKDVTWVRCAVIVENSACDGVTYKNVIFDGNGQNVTCVSYGGTNTTYDGCKFINAANGHYYGAAKGLITFTGCTFDVSVYAINQSEGNATVVINDCTIKGWNSFGGTEKVTVANTSFAKSANYGKLRFNSNATLIGCSFSADYVDPTNGNVGLDITTAGAIVTLTGCEVEGHRIHEICNFADAEGIDSVFAFDARQNAAGEFMSGTFLAKDKTMVPLAPGCDLFPEGTPDLTIVGVNVSRDDEGNKVPAFEQASDAKVDEQAAKGVVTDPEVVTKMLEQTSVIGVKLTSAAPEGQVSGMQAVVDKAKLQSEEVRQALESDSALMVTVKVDVVVTPVSYTAPSQEDPKGEIVFDLKPEATVTVVSMVGEQKTSVSTKVDVTNSMLDQAQDILVTIYTGFEPAVILHRTDRGVLIDSYTDAQFAYAEGSCTLTIRHFSQLVPMQTTKYVATANGQMFETVQGAVDYLGTEAGTVGLLKTAELTTAVTVAAGQTVTLDLAGKTLKWAGNATSTADGLVANAGTLAITGGTLDAGATVFATCSGKLEIADGIFKGAFPTPTSTETNAGPIYVSGGKFTEQVPPAYCAEGYVPDPNQTYDGYWTVKNANVFIRNVKAVQRYPWNGYVDITFEMCMNREAEVTLFVAAYDQGERVTGLTKVTWQNAEGGAKEVDVANGTFKVAAPTVKKIHLVWNSNVEGAYKDAAAEDITVKVIAK